MLENMTKMLNVAIEGGYAVGAFNILDYNSMLAAVEAAEQLKAPVIIQTSAKTVIFWGTGSIISWAREIASDVAVPVALHLDHCKDLELIRSCIDAGWTSVMIDASSMPFEENIALSRQVVEMAEGKDVSVEAELGEIVGVEDDIFVSGEDAGLADPAKSELFCKEVALQCFAPGVGTAHGVYKGKPRIAFDRIEEIAQRTGLPLALHGGTGLAADEFRKCISLGCAKINISTQLKYAFIDGFVQYHAAHIEEYNPLKVISAQFELIKRVVAENVKLFGSAGRAN